MSGRIDDLIQAKYKNLPFLIRKETLNSIGQKRIKHDYPNTNVRYSEPQGKAPFDATIDIFFSGVNWKENFENFRKALEDPSPGRLYMPTFGIFNNIVAEPSTAEADQTAVGEIKITVNFYETFDKPSPTETDPTSEDIFEKGQEARDELQAQTGESYENPNSLNNLKTSESDFKKLAENIRNITGQDNAFNTFIRNLSKNIRSGTGIARLLLNNTSPLGLLQTISNVLSGDQAYNQYKKIALLGSTLSNSMSDIRLNIIPKKSTVTQLTPEIGINVNINVWDDDTLERQQRNNNRYIVINTFRIFGLIGMYEQAASRRFTTTNEVDNTIKELELYYTEIIQNDSTGIIIPLMKELLDQLKGLSESVLKDQRQKAFNVIEIFVEKPYSSKLLCYELYGELIKKEVELNYLSDLIVGLNRSLPAHKLQGTVKVVEIG